MAQVAGFRQQQAVRKKTHKVVDRHESCAYAYTMSDGETTKGAGTMINESIKPSSKAIRVLKCIRDEQSWRASWETVEEITSMGWAIFFGLDDVEDPRYT